MNVMDSTYTIIIADDHPLFRNALFQSVHMAISGANLLEADSLDALLTLLKKEDEPDLVCWAEGTIKVALQQRASHRLGGVVGAEGGGNGLMLKQWRRHTIYKVNLTRWDIMVAHRSP